MPAQSDAKDVKANGAASSAAPSRAGTTAANGNGHAAAAADGGGASGSASATVIHYVRELAQHDAQTGYSLAQPRGIDVDTKTRTVYVADTSNSRVCRIDAKPAAKGQPCRMTVLCGRADTSGFKDGSSTEALFAKPSGVAFDGTDVFVADSDNHRIRRVALADGSVSTFAGSGPTGAGAGGFADGDALTTAQFNAPSDVYAHRATKSLYIADTQNHRIRVVRNGTVTTLAGGALPGAKDANGVDACFRAPTGVAVDSAGNVYVADRGNNVIRRITADGTVTTYAGTLAHDSETGAHNEGFKDGPAADAQFRAPERVSVDHTTGDVYVSDTGNHRIRKVHRDAGTGALTVSTVVGNGQADATDGALGSDHARVHTPTALFAGEGLHDHGPDEHSAMVFADTGSNRVRIVDHHAPKEAQDCRMCGGSGDCTLM